MNNNLLVKQETPYFFVVDTYMEGMENDDYNTYITEVKPIIESYGGEYLVRTNNIICLNEKRQPKRIIIIKFPSKESLENCFKSTEYKRIAIKRENNTDSRAIIVPAFKEDINENTSNQNKI